MDIDTTKPNAGRIYDYMLGGHHNFEADRVAAEQINQLAPQVRKLMHLNRWFMLHVVDELASAGFQHYLDLATGLPTQGYLHERVPETARIIYNDIDPATVLYARQILQDRPNVRYVQSDIRALDTILSEAERLFGDHRRVAIFMVGIAYFIDNESLAKILEQLYAWAAPGSRLAISLLTVERPPSEDDSVMGLYRQMNAPLYPRTHAEIARVLGRWQPIGTGLINLTAYIANHLSEALTIDQGPEHETMSGGIFEKPEA